MDYFIGERYPLQMTKCWVGDRLFCLRISNNHIDEFYQSSDILINVHKEKYI